MKLTKSEKLALLQKWKASYDRTEAVTDKLRELVNDATGQLYDALWANFDDQTRTIGLILGDEAEWMNWYELECDMGRKPLEAGKDGKMKKIKTLNQLLWIIEL